MLWREVTTRVVREEFKASSSSTSWSIPARCASCSSRPPRVIVTENLLATSSPNLTRCWAARSAMCPPPRSAKRAAEALRPCTAPRRNSPAGGSRIRTDDRKRRAAAAHSLHLEVEAPAVEASIAAGWIGPSPRSGGSRRPGLQHGRSGTRSFAPFPCTGDTLMAEDRVPQPRIHAAPTGRRPAMLKGIGFTARTSAPHRRGRHHWRDPCPATSTCAAGGAGEEGIRWRRRRQADWSLHHRHQRRLHPHVPM